MQPSTPEYTPPEVVRADPRARRIVIVAVGIAAVIGATAIEWLPQRLSALVSAGHISRKSICIGFLIFVSTLVTPVVVAGVQICRRGREMVKSRRFPTEGTRVLVDTPVKRGADAVRLGKVQQVLGTSLIVMALLLLCVAGFGVYKLW